MTSSPILELDGVSYAYGGVQALRTVSLPIYPGQILGIAGDTGAGKSTLAQILAGAQRPTTGRLLLDGQVLDLSSTAAGRAAGIVAVFAELGLIDDFSVAINIFLGQWPRRRFTRIVDEVAAEKQATQLLHQLGVSIRSVHAPLAELDASARQSVAVARGLLGNPRAVIFDEPTASLTMRGRAQVYTMLDHLRSAGLAVVVLSHQIGELQAIADSVAILRLGRLAGVFDPTTSYEDLLAAMTGQLSGTTALTRRPEQW